MDNTTKKSLIWGGMLVIEAIILKLVKKSELWFYVALPIIAGFLLTELIFSKSGKSKRNLK